MIINDLDFAIFFLLFVCLFVAFLSFVIFFFTKSSFLLGHLGFLELQSLESCSNVIL